MLKYQYNKNYAFWFKIKFLKAFKSMILANFNAKKMTDEFSK